MKKIIVSAIIICLILSVMPLSIGENNAGAETSYEINGNVNPDNIIDALTSKKESNKLSDKDGLPLKIPKSEFIPGEIIVKFKDDYEVNFYTSTVSVQNIGETIQTFMEETIAANPESSSCQQATITTEELESLQTEELLMSDLETLDKLNIVYGLKYAEKLIEDDSIPEFSKVYRLCFNENISVLRVVEDYNNDASVEFAEPNYIYHYHDRGQEQSNNNPMDTGFIPNDPYFDMQWALHNTGQTGGTPGADIDAPEAWNITMGDDEVVIAILDTGVDYTNPELGGCTDGIIELDFNLESQHPLPGSETIVLNFSDIFSEYDFDSISLHFSQIDQYAIIRSGMFQSDLIDKKWLLDTTLYDGMISDIWTKYSEMGSYKVEIYSAGWGWAIDKVRLSKFIELSTQSDKFVDGYDFFCHDPDPMDDVGHGTHCAGIVAAVTNNNIGVAGVAGNCKIMPIRVGGDFGFGLFSIERGLIFAANHGADIISMSFGGLESLLMKIILDYAYNKGCVLVASAGNFNLTIPLLTFPGTYEKVIGVSSTDPNDCKASFSCYGSYVDVAAPGWDILSLRAHGTDMYLGSEGYPPGAAFVPQYDNNAILYRCWGTSMSCPHVAGVAALILSTQLDLTTQEVRTILRSSTDPVITDTYIGIGRINAHKAVKKAAPVIAEFDKSLNDAIIEGNFEIKGTASARSPYQFEYVIEYGKGLYPLTWTEIKHSTSPKDGVLCPWSTLEVDDGPCVLRLRVMNNGFTYEDRAFVTLDNVANTYHVDDVANNGDGSETNPFNKVQYAVDICCNKDTIFVHEGVYNDIIIQETGRSAKIVGENRENTIIQEIVFIAYGGISIEKCTIKNWGVEGYPTRDCKIQDNNFIDAYGIELGPTDSKIDILRNKFTGDETSIFLIKCSNCKISENTLPDGKIHLIDCKHITISDNLLQHMGIYASDNNDIKENTISGSSYDGILVDNGQSNKICNNNIIDTQGHGIELRHKGYFLPNYNNIISGNIVSNVKYGIYFGVGDETRPLLGYNIPACSYNEISKNEITNSEIGILLIGSNHNTIYENILSHNNKYGITIRNALYGLDYPPKIFYSKNNKIYLNDFIQNGDPENEDTGNGYDEGYNTWYQPLLDIGNYWSDYCDKYPNANKISRVILPDIWDTPYDITGGDNQDECPLVNEYSDAQSNPQSSPDGQQTSQSTPSGTEGSNPN